MTDNTTLNVDPPPPDLGEVNRAASRGYQYQHGQRPLEGFTIQRGAGRGGFGEVYYALSDSGREVALKLVLTYEQIELRGISQCMNLKSPHLVTIFDVKYGTDGRPWVIMEYVAGPSLRQLLDEAPSGLGTQKAAFFLREIGKGLTYLHDCGIVHRDLKPGNIFYENGYVKIGDYGLSKAISTSRHSGQTVTVGTVHYMAPEIGAGNYDRGIDIYAMGALLYEMLTGQVPFFGASPAEVLMKHLSATADVSGIEEPFKTVILKAMAKDPTQRYQSVQEMVEAVFGAEHVRNSVSHFSPESLTIVAGHAAQKIGSFAGPFTPSDAPASQPAPKPWEPGWQWDQSGRFARSMERMNRKIARANEKITRSAERLGARWGGPPMPAAPAGEFASADSIRFGPRTVMGVVAAVLTAIVGGIVGNQWDRPEIGFVVFWSVAFGTAAAILLWYLVGPMLRNESPWMMRLAVGGSTGALAILPLMSLHNDFRHFNEQAFGGTLLAVFAGLMLMDWPARLAPARQERVSFGHLITAAILGAVLGGMFDGLMPLVVIELVGISLATGLVAAWYPRMAAEPPPLPRSGRPGIPRPVAPPVPSISAPPSPHPAPSAMDSRAGEIPVTLPLATDAAGFPVPRWARVIWHVLFIVAANVGLCLWLTLMLAEPFDSYTAAIIAGIATGTSILALMAIRRALRVPFGGYWNYLFKPLLQYVCLQAAVMAASFLTIGRVRGDDVPPAIVFLVFPSILLFVLTFLIKRGGPMVAANVLHPVRQRVATLSLGGLAFGLGRFAVTMIGAVVLIVSLMLTVAVVTNLPGLIESGALDRRMPSEMASAFGTPTWPHLLLQIGAVMAFVTAALAAHLLLLPRRRWGGTYMLTCLVGIALLHGAVIALGQAPPSWSAVAMGRTPAMTLEWYFDSLSPTRLMSGAALLVLGMLVLLWPPAARKKREVHVAEVPAQTKAAV